jgi:hypothetical protein
MQNIEKIEAEKTLLGLEIERLNTILKEKLHLLED